MDVVEQQTENLELHTNALQILLGEACPPTPHKHPASTGNAKQHPHPSSPPALLSSSSF